MNLEQFIHKLTHGALTDQQSAIRWYEAAKRFLADSTIDAHTREITWTHLANRYHKDFLKHFNAFTIEDNTLIHSYPLFISQADMVERERVRNARVSVDLGDGQIIQVSQEDEDADYAWNRENTLSPDAVQNIMEAHATYMGSIKPPTKTAREHHEEQMRAYAGFGVDTDFQEYLRSLVY